MLKSYLQIKFAVVYAIVLVSTVLCTSSCSNESFDFDNPDIPTYIQQLKSGKLQAGDVDAAPSFPKFNYNDIDELLKYANDFTEIPIFPLSLVTISNDKKIRLGECVLWTIESIRIGHPASIGCKLVYKNADNYEGIYFLTNDDLDKAVSKYRQWWDDLRANPRQIDLVDPLKDSDYMWW